MPAESENAVRIGIEATCTAVLLALVVIISIFAQRWYVRMENYIGTKDAIQEQADVYKLESIGKVSGVDVIEFIIQYDSYYDYYITTKSTVSSLEDISNKYTHLTDTDYFNDNVSCDVKITKHRYNTLVQSTSAANKQLADILWSEDYLIYEVFGNYVLSDYYVCPFRQNDSTVAYMFVRASN